ncbi:MAG: universal stress protein [Bacteroidetes bacterium]|nr:universal stress protein [Bacteroidota bacterium]
MKKILIALDYNPTAKKVAEIGFSLAKAMNAKAILLHVVANAVYYASTDYSPIMGFTGYMDTRQKQLDSIDGLKLASLNFLEKSKRHLGDENITTLVKEGDFADSILEAAKELHVDAIVMGTHSRKWLEEILMGSVTEKVLHQSSIPLLIIPTRNTSK